jgi:hypothetical protein
MLCLGVANSLKKNSPKKFTTFLKMKERSKPKKIGFSFWKFLVIGVIIRLILMPITLHPDILGHSFSAYFLAYEGKINLYDTLADLPSTHPLVKNFGVSDIFIYPPLTYYTLGLFRVLVIPLADSDFIPWLMENLSQIHSYSGLYLHLFLFKAPYLFFDIGAAFLLAGLFDDSKKRKLAFSLWMLNPVTIYATFMVGQLDLLPAFFTLLAVYLFKKQRFSWAAFSVGVAASFKMYPIFLLFPLAFLSSDKFVQRIKNIAVGLAPFIFFIAPYLGSSAFRAQVFSPKSQKMLYMGWPLSGAEVVYPFIFGLTVIYFLSYYSKKKTDLSVYFLSILLLIFGVTHFHPQWFLWVTPFLIWELVENNFKNWLLTLSVFGSWLALTLLFEPSLSFGLFNPLWPDLENAVGLSDLINRYTNVFQFKSLIRSLFAGSAFFFIVKLLYGKTKEIDAN